MRTIEEALNETRGRWGADLQLAFDAVTQLNAMMSHASGWYDAEQAKEFLFQSNTDLVSATTALELGRFRQYKCIIDAIAEHLGGPYWKHRKEGAAS